MKKSGKYKSFCKDKGLGKNKGFMADGMFAIDEALHRFNDEDLWSLAQRADGDMPFEFSGERVEQMRRILCDYIDRD